MIKYHHTLEYFTTYLYWHHEIQASNVTAILKIFLELRDAGHNSIRAKADNFNSDYWIKKAALSTSNSSAVSGHIRMF